jgi:hypothetical protein
MTTHARRTLPGPVLLLLLTLLPAPGCASLEYDLSGLTLPVSARPAEAGAAHVEPFTITEKNVLWLHGLFGRDPPDVAALLSERAAGFDRIADLRVSQGPGFHDWLVTHLTLSLVRMKTVTIEGQLVRDSEAPKAR